MATARHNLVAGLILVTMLSCSSDDSGPGVAPTVIVAGSTSTVSATTTITETTATTSAPTITPSTSVEADALSVVLATAVRWRATMGNSWHDPNRFNTLYIFERLGHADAQGFITGLDEGRLLTEAERAAIEAAVTPVSVHWIPGRDVREPPPVAILDHEAIIRIAEPEVVGPRAEVATELWCGFDCGIGSTSVLRQSPSGEWTVTEQIGGYIA